MTLLFWPAVNLGEALAIAMTGEYRARTDFLLEHGGGVVCVSMLGEW